MCVYIFLYVCMYVCMYVCNVCIYIYICLCIYLCINVYVRVCIYLCMYHICMNVRAYICMYVYVCTCVCMYVCMYVLPWTKWSIASTEARDVTFAAIIVTPVMALCIVSLQYGERSSVCAVYRLHSVADSWYGDTGKTKLYEYTCKIEARKVLCFLYRELWRPNLKILCVCSQCSNEGDIAVCSVCSVQCAAVRVLK